ncbi:NAD(P)H-binding protein [uncultured Litoreibacter sp.]|uniref:NAD(P)H-binding protein n=1 Tax=uncultured Litoreibacter sp. TaxID=1392394 RepID=UPI002608FC4F|nr:NAD(P)H-binding protein [uncultured Litoreibacter sp.]
MKLIVFGATGDVGSRVVAEAFSRGHDVTAAVRNVAGLGKLDLCQPVRDVASGQAQGRL